MTSERSAATDREDLAIELRGVHKVYSEGASRRVVFEGVDLEVRRGEFAVVLGRSGSGKSTLLNLISGIDAPDSGDITVSLVNWSRCLCQFA